MHMDLDKNLKDLVWYLKYKALDFTVIEIIFDNITIEGDYLSSHNLTNSYPYIYIIKIPDLNERYIYEFHLVSDITNYITFSLSSISFGSLRTFRAKIGKSEPEVIKVGHIDISYKTELIIDLIFKSGIIRHEEGKLEKLHYNIMYNKLLDYKIHNTNRNLYQAFSKVIFKK